MSSGSFVALGLGAIVALGLIGALIWATRRGAKAEVREEHLSAEKEAAKRIIEAESRAIVDSDALLDELRDNKRKL